LDDAGILAEEGAVTKDEWAEVEKRLFAVGCRVELDCDGYRLTIDRVRMTQMRDCLSIYVNGFFKHTWSKDDCEERRRFLCPRTTFFYKPKERAERRAANKKMSKRMYTYLEEMLGPLMDQDKSFTYYSGLWPNIQKLRAHLVKNNKEISLWREKSEAGTDEAETQNAG
jgi:hypothetical protein